MFKISVINVLHAIFYFLTIWIRRENKRVEGEPIFDYRYDQSNTIDKVALGLYSLEQHSKHLLSR